jgi:hypothetical protein
MSSVQSFLRQRVTGSTLLAGPSPATPDSYFVLQADASNYVGNYPPGVMIDASAQVVALVAIAGNGGSTPPAPVLRDMGKTIKATVGLTGKPGFFRAVQIISPSNVASATAQSNYGVIGSSAGFLPAGNAGDDGYATYYIPIVVGGVVASGVTLSTAGVKLGEQL